MSEQIIKSRIDSLIKEFSGEGDWEDKYRKIIALGKKLPPMQEELKIESNEVKGCQSKLWLFASFDGQNVTYQADSNASIVKGIVALLIGVYNDADPEDILSNKPDFIDTIGLRQHLSMSRANGLNSLVKQIFMYALAFKAKKAMNKEGQC